VENCNPVDQMWLSSDFPAILSSLLCET